MKIKPDMYVKDILSINYKKLKEKGIKALFFDFDNTLIEMGNYTLNEKYEKLIEKIKKDFKVMIVSNSIHASKLEKVCSKYNLSYVGASFKPFFFGFKKAEKLVGFKEQEICMIGDQLVTDIYGGNRFGMFTILVDPLGKKDLKITGLNRFIERKILNKYEKQNIMKKGVYYE